MTRILALIVFISAGLGVAPALAVDLGRALEQVRAEDWRAAGRSAGRETTIARDVVEWHRLRAGEGSAADVMAFLNRRPSWPGLPLLRRRSEAVIATADTRTILAFYENSRPRTARGALSLAQALRSSGRSQDADATLVKAWRSLPMGAETQSDYLSRHARLLAPHHDARIDQMLWDGHETSATGMLPLVSDGQRKLAEARLALQQDEPGVDGRIAAVPVSLRDHPGLAYDRFAWRDRKRRQDDAIDLMMDRSTSAKALGDPAKWLRRRRDFARQLLRDGKYEQAYQLAAHHFATPDMGYGYADSEWIAGYIALRKLQDPELAVFHFDRFMAAVSSPISIGRGGYWLGRAHAALGDADKAYAAYARAAEYQTSFYGLLAAEAVGRPFDPDLVSPPSLPDWRGASFLNSSVAQAGLMLLEADELSLAERFLTHLVEQLDPQSARQLGAMAVAMEQPHLAVMIAKRAAADGEELEAAYFPLHPVAQRDLPMAPEMTLAIARRESEFDPVVISHAGARGLMQVMPATADLVARTIGTTAQHSTGRLISDWPYNALLGSHYLAGLAADFDGNVVMMAAGYNAGPHRPKAWMERYGDPRTSRPDVIDWIEHIPFNETRNYVMRVTESLPVYRARLGQPALPIPFSRELTGSTLQAFAPKGE
ncbi:lytic transglycosylase domain-containing protein [Phaeobacter sp.]|uniref:lytic transglycosylase domain-containing protein n=1 Tax=Phaeobacter sp. TaxID=1902409 RepID=UPI0025FE0E18|nr:lytic transglycosylase domain-containing protein [Phaeobacter sp.]